MLYDLIIIGAGAAGIIAAIETSNKGLKVCLLEQNASIGQKLSITGGGRCNLTSNISLNDFEKYIPRNYKFIQSALSQFSNENLLSYLSNINIKTKIEGEKIYLKSEDGMKLIENFESTLQKNVDLLLNTKVQDIIFLDKQILHLKTTKGTLKAKEYLIASGGMSYPNLGSDGSILNILSSKNIFYIEETYPSLVPINIKNNIFSKLAGISIKSSLNLKFGKKQKQLTGELLFTHKGISGPLALNFSSYLVDLEKNSYSVYIDFLPEISKENLKDEFKKNNGKTRISTILNDKLPKKLIKTLFPEDIYDFSNLKINKLELMIEQIKKYNIEISSFEGYNKAIVTRGGISTKEINPKTMKSKKIDNLYFAGEIIDVDGFTGGYNLQIAFSTGYVAAKNIGGYYNETFNRKN